MNEIKGVKVLNYFRVKDSRGVFEKPLANIDEHFPNFRGLAEFFSSTSEENVWRGFHLQVGEYASNRIIYCSSGRATDYLIDLRENSKTFRYLQKIELNHEKNAKMVCIPAGVAHGFLSKSNDTVINYFSDRPYSSLHDTGIRVDEELDFELANELTTAKMSERDKSLPSIEEYIRTYLRPIDREKIR